MFLALREKTLMPVVSIAPHQPISIGNGVAPTGERTGQLQITIVVAEYQDDYISIEQPLRILAEWIDLLEPFKRIESALCNVVRRSLDPQVTVSA